MNASQQISCPKCGTINKIVAKFCQDCGFSFEETKSKPLETSSQDNSIKNPPEYEVTERKRIRVYSIIILTIFFTVFFITLGILFPEFLSYGLVLIVILLCLLNKLLKLYIQDFVKISNNLVFFVRSSLLYESGIFSSHLLSLTMYNILCSIVFLIFLKSDRAEKLVLSKSLAIL